MADNYGVNARVSIEVVNAKQLNDLNNALAKLQTGEALTAKETAALEKAMKALAAAQVNATSASQGNLKAIQKQEAAYRTYSQNISLANRTAREAAQIDKALAAAKRQVATDAAAAAKALQQEAAAAAKAAKADAAASAATRDQNVNLSSQRYALYDVARSLTVATTATLGFVTATEAVGTSFEKNFASVERTSGAVGEQLEDLRASLVAISTSMPTSFGDATGIATLGAQLGIAAEDLDEFTKTVSKFSATTDVTIEAAATGFGRLAQLTETPTDEISNLGSAIYQVGLKSVATESQVLAVAQSIAVSGNLAGFSADQIVALGGALASLGVQPEAARGSIMRIFNNITKASAEGGDALDRFAAVAKSSSEDFAQDWKDNPQKAFTAFIEGLGDAKQKAAGILADLGITQIRDQRALQLLASNTDVYTKALDNSAQAYQDNTALSEGYDVVAGTLAAKLQVLGQTLLAVGDAASTLGPLKAVVDALQGLAEGAQKFVGTPVGKVLATVVLGVTALVGVLAGLGAGFALMTASALALRTALTGLNATQGQTVLGFRALVTQLIALKVGQEQATAGQVAYNAALQQGVGRLAASRAGLAAAGTSVRALAASFSLLGKSTVVFAAISAAVYGVTKVFEAFNNSNKTASERATDYFGDLSGLAGALKKDTEDAANGTSTAIRYITGSIDSSTKTLAPWAENLQGSTGAMVALNDATTVTTDSVKKQTIAIGESSKAWLANAIANDTAFQKAFQNSQQVLANAGFSLSDYINQVLSQDNGGTKYLDDLETKIREVDAATAAATPKTDFFGNALKNSAQQGEFANGIFEKTGKSGQQVGVFLSDSARESVGALRGLGKAADAQDSAFNTMADSVDFFKQVMDAANLSAQDGANGLEEEGDAANDAAAATANFANAQISAINSMYALGQSLAENGSNFDIYSANGRANLSALNSTIDAVVASAGDDTGQLTAYLVTLMNYLTQFGINSVSQLGVVGDRIASLMGGAGVDISQFKGLMEGTTNTLNQGYAGGMANVAKQTSRATDSTKDLAKEVRTLSDYVDDIEEIADAAFDFRHGLDDARDALDDFIAELKEKKKEAKADAKKDPVSIRDIFDAKTGRREALDSIISAYQDLVDAARDAKDALRDANNSIKDTQATIKGLGADKSVLEYQLKIAEKYGDTLRAQEIRAELAKNAADQAKAEADLAKAKEDAKKATQDQNKSLKGNSVAAVNNRNKVRGLQSEYVDYIQSLIDSGASQKEINAAVKQAKKDFMAQGQALGYSADELAAYSTIFDSYTTKQKKASDEEKKETKAQQNSAQAKRDNKKALEDLYKKYQDYIGKLIESGASEEDVQQAVKDSKDEFKRLGTQLGYSEDDVDDVAGSFDDLKTSIKNTPKKVTIKASADLDPAKRALREWKAKKTVSVQAKIHGPKGGYSINGTVVPKNKNVSIDQILADYFKAKKAEIEDAAIRGPKGNGKNRNTAVPSKGGHVPNYLASGGRTVAKGYGPKGTDTIPAWLTPGEFVITKRAVDTYGLPFMNALNNMQVPQQLSSGSRGGNSTFPSTIVVELSPTDRALVAAGNQAVLLLDGKKVGAAINGMNTNDTTRNNH